MREGEPAAVGLTDWSGLVRLSDSEVTGQTRGHQDTALMSSGWLLSKPTIYVEII